MYMYEEIMEQELHEKLCMKDEELRKKNEELYKKDEEIRQLNRYY